MTLSQTKISKRKHPRSLPMEQKLHDDENDVLIVRVLRFRSREMFLIEFPDAEGRGQATV